MNRRGSITPQIKQKNSEKNSIQNSDSELLMKYVQKLNEVIEENKKLEEILLDKEEMICDIKKFPKKYIKQFYCKHCEILMIENEDLLKRLSKHHKMKNKKNILQISSDNLKIEIITSKNKMDTNFKIDYIQQNFKFEIIKNNKIDELNSKSYNETNIIKCNSISTDSIPLVPQAPRFNMSSSEQNCEINTKNIHKPSFIPSVPGITRDIPKSLEKSTNITSIPSVPIKINGLSGVPSIPSAPENFKNIPVVVSTAVNMDKIPNYQGVQNIQGISNTPNIPIVPIIPKNIGIPCIPNANIPRIPSIPSIPSNISTIPGVPKIPCLSASIPSIPKVPNVPGKTSEVSNISGVTTIPVIPNLPFRPPLPGVQGKLPGLPPGLPPIPGMKHSGPIAPLLGELHIMGNKKQPTIPKLICKSLSDNKNITRKKIQVRQIPTSQIKNTFWFIWVNEQEVPVFIDGDIIDKYFAQEIKKEIKKPERRNSVVVPEKILVSLFDDKRSRNLSIILSRFGVSSSDMYRILNNFEVDSLQLSI